MANLRSNYVAGTVNQVQVWVNFFFNGSGASVRNSFNISSVSRTGGGTYQLNYANSLSGTGNVVSGSSRASTNYTGSNWAQYMSPYSSDTTYIGIQVLDNGDLGQGVNEEPAQCSVIIHGPSSSLS
jgi:hypothetical protein